MNTPAWVAAFVLVASTASAQQTDCDAQAALVMQAVESRATGEPMRKTRRALREELGRTAGDALAEWIYALPPEQLTDAVGESWKAQCEAL
ncbi:hypothetical protein KUH32_11075 [Thalassococcus sp. CAU 1522]|uniref:Uncharacterized protein n=1 Tax=Thalassococcus arenae TaxID=2851652 RepID=A0ABS6N8I1_9RHOB|nr:hypothetical protein [Thalassococcus arenae]MBV2360320.1 hypothetical protein [Thalassococcus arenae]